MAEQARLENLGSSAAKGQVLERSLDRLASFLSVSANTRGVYGLAVLIVALVGLVLFGVVHWVLPEGGDYAGTIAFYDKYQVLVKACLLVAGVGAVAVIAIIGTLAALFWHLDTSKHHVLSWVAVVSDTIFGATMFIELSLAAAPALLYGHVADEIVHALHIVPFASAYILGVVWIPNVAATLLIGSRSGLFPLWLKLLGLATVGADFLALLAVTTLTGPLNAVNGFVSFYIPAFLPTAWFIMLCVWSILQWANTRTTSMSDVNE
ncbi:hypothetical protein [Mycobacteroides abscessus]|uniref:hypothetical protein n=1 Tax=Mycobacteroides abscessus TaxID=36809 RepID=UPI00078C988D|nr:hypothetical protein [Mycobacteroides abscessus]AMU75779.1 hypothetical protein A3O06_15000 [Mycobacteroides abscessus]ANO24724.1 hypothetical protein BAB79_14995 [Mycobacteroides abscessus]